MGHLFVLANTSQFLTIRATPSWPISSVVATIYDSDGDIVGSWDEASVTAPKRWELASGTYGHGQSESAKITLAADASQSDSDFARGDPVVIGCAVSGQTEAELREEAIVSRWMHEAGQDSDLYLMHPLALTFATSEATWSVWSKLVYLSLSDSDFEDPARDYMIKVKWTGVSGAELEDWYSFDVVTRIPRPKLTESDLRIRYPSIAAAVHTLSVDRRGWIQLYLEQAWEDVLTDLRRYEIYPDLIVDTAQLSPAIAARLRVLAAEGDVMPAHDWDPREWLDYTHVQYTRELNQVRGALRLYDADDDTVIDSGETITRGFASSYQVM